MDLYRNETDLFEMCCQVVEKKKKSYKRRNSDKHFANGKFMYWKKQKNKSISPI